MEANCKPKFQKMPIPQKTVYFMQVSFQECVDLTERDVLCPYCQFPADRVFSDARGHLRLKCPKCKGTAVVNLAYFRKSKDFGKLKSQFSK